MRQMKAQWKKRGRILVLSLLLCLLVLPIKAQAAEIQPGVFGDVDFGGTPFQGDKLSSLTIREYDADKYVASGKIVWKNPDERMKTAATGGTIPYYDAYCYTNENVPEEISIPVPVLPIAKIEITKQPSKTTYLLGEDFDASSMQVTAYYNDIAMATAANGEESYPYSRVLDAEEYTITDGTNLKEGQQTVTIKTNYGQTVTQPITVTTGYTVKINGFYDDDQYGYKPGFDKVNHILTLNCQAGETLDFRIIQPEGCTYQGITIGKGITKDQLTIVDTAESLAAKQAFIRFTMPANDVELTINWSGQEEQKTENQDKTENTENTDKKEESSGTDSNQNSGSSTSSGSGSSSSGSSSSSSSTPAVSEPQTPAAAPKTADTNADRLAISFFTFLVTLAALSILTRRSFWRGNNH